MQRNVFITKLKMLSNYDAELLNQLWQILPYAGVADILTSCNRKLDLSTPAELVSCLTGIPFNGRNNQVNQDLRLITFSASNLRGPIAIDREQLFFSNPVLRNHVEWTIEPLEPVNKVSIGFYTSNYTNVSIGEYRLIPLLTTAGPAFYTVKKKLTGSFETLGTRDMYVIVNANVSVKLRVTYQKPAVAEPRCFTELWEEESIYVTYRKRGICKKELAVTQKLVKIYPKTLFLRPADKYINLSNAMIRYLASKSVKVLILNEPETLSNTRLKLTASSKSLQVIFPSPTFKADFSKLDCSKLFFQNYTVESASFSQGTLIIQSVAFKILINDMPLGDYVSIFDISPGISKSPNPELDYDAVSNLCPLQQTSFDRLKVVFPIVIDFTSSVLIDSSLATSVIIQIRETRNFERFIDLSQSTLEVTDYVLTLGTPTTQ